MPNYKSDNLTFLTVAEMTSMLVDNTDQDGLLFAVATDSTNFKIVMWRQNSTATIDNETVFPANGPGRWHVLAAGGAINELADVNITAPTAGQTLSFDGTNWINAVASGGGGNPVEYIWDGNLPPSTPASLPVTPAPGKSIYYLASAGVASVHVSSAYLYVNSSWLCISASSVSISQVVGIEYSYDDLSVLWLNSSSYGLGNVVPFSDMQLALGPTFNCYEPPSLGYFSSTMSGYYIYVYRQSDNAYVKIKPNISGQHLVIQGYYNESYFDFLFLSDCLGADYWRRIA